MSKQIKTKRLEILENSFDEKPKNVIKKEKKKLNQKIYTGYIVSPINDLCIISWEELAKEIKK